MTAEELDWPSRASAAAADGASSGIGPHTTDLTELFRQHHLELVRLAALLVRSREAGEDIVQDVFIKIHARRAGPPGPAGALAYLRRAVVNGCRSWLRRQAVARRLGSADRTAVDVHESAEHAAITAENRRRLQAKLFCVAGAAARGAGAAVLRGDGRTYVAAYISWETLRTSLFRFTVTSAGQVADFSRLTTRRLPVLTEPSLAISANGVQVALAGIPARSAGPSSGPPRLLVVNLRTGRVRTWHGLAGTGPAYSIEDPAWTTNRSLRFLVMKCHPSRAFPFNATCQGGGPAGPPGPPAGAEWTLNVPHGSGPLGPGRVLVRLPGVTVQALSGPGADSVTALQLPRSGGIRIARYDVATGRLQQILYRGAGKSNYAYDELAVDGSGRYLLINERQGAFFGWIRHGRFHKLPIHAPFGNNEIVAATW